MSVCKESESILRSTVYILSIGVVEMYLARLGNVHKARPVGLRTFVKEGPHPSCTEATSTQLEGRPKRN